MNNKKTLIFGGDFCLNHEDYVLSDEIVRLFNSSDYCILNLEAPILTNEVGCPYEKAGVNIYQGEGAINILKKLNVQYLGGANNHIFDYGKEGIIQTKDILKKNNIKFGGFGINLEDAKRALDLENSEVSIICVGEEEFGVARDDGFGIFSMYEDSVLKKIKELKDLGKYVIVYAHGGGELVPLPSKYIISRFDEFIDNGADLVIGHHPHIPQGIREYKNKYIFYSLGNFIHGQFEKSWGIAVKIDIANMAFLNYEIIFLEFKNKTLSILKHPEKYNNYIEIASNILKNEEDFHGALQEWAATMFNSYYKNYFTNLFKGTFLFFIKKFIKRFILKQKITMISKEQSDLLLLYHLIRNKSHLSFIEIALGLRTKEVKDFRTETSRKSFNYLKRFMKYE